MCLPFVCTPLMDRILPLIDVHLHTPNEIALSRIVPPPTIRSQRRIARVRLRMMQAELNAPETSPIENPARQILVGGGAE
jgi:hypothetical protein